MISKNRLEKMYLRKGMSVQAIADKLGYSRRGVKYWMDKHSIPNRTMSEAMYLWHHPSGDPFNFQKPRTKKEHELFGLGLGLYWGEGTKSNKHAIRLGNTDPKLLVKFIEFLEIFFQISRKDLKFGLQIFSDISANKALKYWTKELKVSKNQFHKPTVTKSGSIGTYRKKSLYGVTTVYYSNVKARQILNKYVPM